ncbi:MAG: hypothetical protein P8169_14365, partial [Chloroflexota bacterium]
MSTNPELRTGGGTVIEEDNPYGIEDVSVAPFVPDRDDVESIYVAPNWKLVWWRFRKHKLAVISTIIVFIIGLVATLPGFFSTLNPHESMSTELFIPPQRLHFFDDGKLQPFVYSVEGVRNPVTLRMEWQTNYEEKVY